MAKKRKHIQARENGVHIIHSKDDEMTVGYRITGGDERYTMIEYATARRHSAFEPQPYCKWKGGMIVVGRLTKNRADGQRKRVEEDEVIHLPLPKTGQQWREFDSAVLKNVKANINVSLITQEQERAREETNRAKKQCCVVL